MMTVRFHSDQVRDAQLKFAVILAEYDGQWVYSRRVGRTTLEVPGGHREPGETIEETAARELWEETGARTFSLTPVAVYSCEDDGTEPSFGKLFHADITELGALPESEITEIVLLDTPPERDMLTYPEIQPALVRRYLMDTAEYCLENGAVSAALAEQIAQLRNAVGWRGIQALYTQLTSYARVCVRMRGRLVGFADAVSNGVTDAYIQDVMVAPDLQGCGIGTAMMQMMISHLRERGIFMISVIYEDALRPFYARFGFFPLCAGQLQTDIVKESEGAK